MKRRYRTVDQAKGAEAPLDCPAILGLLRCGRGKEAEVVVPHKEENEELQIKD